MTEESSGVIFGVWFLIGAALVFWMQAGFAMGVLPHTVKHKADMLAVQFHKLRFHKLCRVVVPRNPHPLSGGAYGFKMCIRDSCTAND